ncbi:hypothetical protein PMN64_37340 [Bradyrhizobium sp. UFLA01-814]|uniref:hypothetical protein n=1 Tax=unclassified Bradyrhizobium TaxID=2631580 RepID=UPI00398B5FA6
MASENRIDQPVLTAPEDLSDRIVVGGIGIGHSSPLGILVVDLARKGRFAEFHSSSWLIL